MPLSVTLISRNSANSLSANGKLRPAQDAGQLADLGARDAAGAQRHPAALGGELHRVREQVVEDLLDLARVRLNRAQLLGGIHAPGGCGGSRPSPG